ncbi:MAG: hypothetical protein LCI00_04490 [Chloroflexi bacterium]|nr:hypothetical protein [Chloroflexota bacterium]MCC6894112.1 hypothetical protein [Anaerolineae bacterium]
MRYFRRSGNPNALVGIFLLVLLAIFAGPGMLPNLLPNIIPGADESIMCAWLRTGTERAQHQSLIGRTATNPISLRVRTSALPSAPGQTLQVNIVITNNSLGTVAIYYNPAQVRYGDDGVSSGLGLIPNSNSAIPRGQNTGGSIPESDIRLLGPRQSCIHHTAWTFEQIGSLGLNQGINTFKAYYRSTSAGVAQVTTGTTQAIYSDQGLWVGVTESEAVPIPSASG